jgi:hypothetical protein
MASSGASSQVVGYDAAGGVDPDPGHRHCGIVVHQQGVLAGKERSMGYPATTAMATVDVAQYDYDGNGRLSAAWDPEGPRGRALDDQASRLADICGRDRDRKRPWSVGIRRLSKLDGSLARRAAHQDHGRCD